MGTPYVDPNYQTNYQEGKYKDYYADGTPKRPEYNNSAWDDKTGLLKDQYQVKNQYNDAGLKAMREGALRTGPSAWANMMNSQLSSQLQDSRNLASQQAAANLANSRQSLAMRGGLRGGAMERLARGSMQDTMMQNQSITRQGVTGRQNIGLQDEQQRLGMLSQLPGQEMAAAQNSQNVSQYNIGEALREKRLKDAFNMEGYKERMRAYSSKQVADAQKPPEDNSWICTEVNRILPLTQEEKDLLWKLKIHNLTHHFDTSKFYLRECDKLVGKMREANFDWSHLIGFQKSIVTLIRAGELEAAYVLYRDFTIELMQKYWPDCDSPAYLATVEEMNAGRRGNEISLPELKAEDQDLLGPVLKERG